MLIVIAFALLAAAPAFADGLDFTAGDLVVSVEGNGVEGGTGTYTDNQAAPLSLFEFDPTGTSSVSYVSSLVLPQTASGVNLPVSGEYGSSSEGTLQLSEDGQYLTIMGYGVNAASFNAAPGSYSTVSTNTALGQSGSMTGQSAYTPVARVVALIDADGNVNSSTAIYNVFNANNPRSAFAVSGTPGSAVYISGQGTKGDNTGGVFYTTVGSTSATSITGADGGSGSSQDTREVQIVNGQLYVSSDSKTGATNRDYIGTLGASGSLPTTVANSGNGPTMLTGYGNTGGTGKETITALTANGENAIGQQINLSPENYFFASSTVLYVADSGSPKNNSATSALGDGGLQKWVDVSGTWTLEYTISAGLNLVANTAASGTTGLYGLTGEVMPDGTVELFATNYTIEDLDPTYLYGVTDVLSATTPGGTEAFTQLASAPADSNFKGVSFAPVAAAEPGSLALLGIGLIALLLLRRRQVIL